VLARSAVVSWRSQPHFKPQIAQLLVDTLDGRIDTRFPRLYFPRPGKLLRSILLRWVHCKDTVYARTFSFLIRHYQSVLSNSDLPAPMTEALQLLT